MATRPSPLRGPVLTLALTLTLVAAAARSRRVDRLTELENEPYGTNPATPLSARKVSYWLMLLKSLGFSLGVRPEFRTNSNTGSVLGHGRTPSGNLEMKRKSHFSFADLSKKSKTSGSLFRGLSLQFKHKRKSPEAYIDQFGEHLNPTDFQNARKIENKLPTDRPDNFVDPIENVNGPDLFEGDVVHDRQARNMIMNPDKKWPRGEVPYTIASGFSSSERATIASAVLEFERNTCIRVRPLAPSDNANQSYVRIIKGDGCFSSIGRQLEPGQELSLGNGCLYPGIVVHEFMHALGFWHEQSRTDRDEHVLIHYDNIKSGKEYNFKSYSKNQVETLSQPYDIGSIMHYGPRAFAKDRSKPTVSALKPTSAQMGQRDGLSRIDINKINKLYSCEDVTAPPTPVVKPMECADRRVYCSDWASTGECDANPLYMKRHCARSCDTCSSGKCDDENERCAAWTETGECTNTPSYMSLYCRKSCGLCKGAKKVRCTDVSPFCKAWAKLDECSKNPLYMNRDCRKACGLC